AFLNKEGYDVYAMDFRGHGANLSGIEGYFADSDGWQRVVNDIKFFVDHIFMNAASNNLILLGHSMGSLLLRSYLIKFYDIRFEKVVLSGTPAAPPALVLRAASILSGAITLFGGGKKPSAFMDKLVFGKYSKSIVNPETPFDWLSHDKEVVSNYISDPACGFVCTGSFFRDLSEGIRYCSLPSNIAKIDPLKKILIISGSEDPAGDFGKAPNKLYKRLTKVLEKGNATLKVYNGYRHEVLNETGRKKVYQDILEFLRL
ncbi:MAG: alpha/beta hydrolase, partial [Eubacteriaceae bacterium]|nr:alpha/beta hydrolase [Eubacteriaceae bacterium]